MCRGLSPKRCDRAQEKRSDYVTKTCDEFERMSTRNHLPWPQFGPKSRRFLESSFESFTLLPFQGVGASQAGFRVSAFGLIKLLARRWCRRTEPRNCHLVVKLRGTRCSFVSARLLRPLLSLSLSLFLFCFDGLIIVATVSCRVAHLQISAGLIESRESFGENPKTRAGFLINLGETSAQVLLWSLYQAEISLDWLPFQRGNWS